MDEDFKMDMAILEENLKEDGKYRNIIKDNIRKLYSIIWGQCSNPMKSKLGVVANYTKTDDKKDSTALLREIKCISYKYDCYRNLYLALDNVKSKFYSYFQK